MRPIRLVGWLTAATVHAQQGLLRRNAVLAVNALYKLPKGELMLQDAPELIEKVRPAALALLPVLLAAAWGAAACPATPGGWCCLRTERSQGDVPR